ncbi:MAG: tryptophan synthase subunit alpha [Oscillospiraceae bacterium]|nr:tryptophan synthase subunit alpha [Oscillospiraceae bacterium]
MENRIDIKFKELKDNGKKALVTFVTAGDPCFDLCEKFIIEMEKEGADLIELGVPFSDPSADGPVIQEANIRAMSNGADIYTIFDFVEKIRDKISVPLVFLIYYNVVFQYGADKFFAKCARVGIDGVIIPDLPYEEGGEIAEYTEKYGVYHINLLSPTSKEDRIKNIAENSKGFLYCISSLGVTGEKDEFSTDFESFFRTIRKYTDMPCCLGFGISGGKQVRMLKDYCDGVIVGSSIVKAASKGNGDEEKIKSLADKMRDLKSGF